MNNMEINDFTKSKIKEIYSNIENTNRFILLRGSIGVGKTLIAKILSKMIIDKDFDYQNIKLADKKWEELVNFEDKDCNEKFSKQVSVVPFHPGSDYENVIYGLKLKTINGNLEYNATERILLNVISKAKKAKEENTDKRYVVILDDVNRGNFSRAMGDILSAVEAKDIGNAVRTPEGNYTIPDNFYLIATFNPTIGNPSIDYAWLRRFMIFDIFSDERYIDDVNDIIERNKIIGRNKVNFFNETHKDKFTDYIYELYMQMKIMFERYFLDDDVNIIKQYMPGHGLFMTYDDSKRDGQNAKKFYYQLRYCIVPLLYQYVKDGLLDQRALLDIEAFEHLYDFDMHYWNNTDKENDKKLEKFRAQVTLDKKKPLKEYILNSMKAVIGKIPDAAFFRFFLQNVSLMFKTKNGDKCFLFESENYDKFTKSISNEKFENNFTKKYYIVVGSIKYYIFSNARKTPGNKELEDISYNFTEDFIDPVQIMFRMFKVLLRVLEFDRYVRFGDFQKPECDDVINTMKCYLENGNKKEMLEMVKKIENFMTNSL